MNWNKFFTGTPDHGHEDETETEDEEDITDSNGTVSTDKRPHFLGMHFHRFSHNDYSQRCVKLTFLIINAATFLAGNVAIVTSTWTLTDDSIMSRLIGQRFFITTLLFIGLIASLVSSLGIIGLLRKRRKLLNIYALCYLSFLCTMFITAIMCFWIFDEITRKIQDDMISSIETYHSSFSSREAWDNTHRYLKCCGIKSAKDWSKYRIDIPKSCCARRLDECLQMTEAVAYKSGCLRNAVLLWKSYMHTISMVTLLLFVVIAETRRPLISIQIKIIRDTDKTTELYLEREIHR
ncbi:leukocyte surface antigen CD53-like [Ceratina calcarata]|uniref:Leukocyte surface antigen CD53-like n=1 Tax=Ceratina calcarata TaxID=156304 RepID=A0AAJ7RXM7_9HYME|nr:leukocyte surface antigen CD53-like [Ceratina calcarata]